ncbi:hypothetical protein OVS_03840 [Mycoplasma ovis str. Michigan]|uniref:Uncharacterized protein n=1 Tax=Mycoplasma ovis str. Michigan TaxID=1415773 RepID=A0ABM5P267_9MOLU|nr:hypothetical protein [Mycoplasma ovis]AHC40500.1 hypothetical protein OVS_03840 [Mycoplasma ovis str. Michigan]
MATITESGETKAFTIASPILAEFPNNLSLKLEAVDEDGFPSSWGEKNYCFLSESPKDRGYPEDQEDEEYKRDNVQVKRSTSIECRIYCAKSPPITINL